MKNIIKKIGLGLMVATFLVALGATKIESSKLIGMNNGGEIRLFIDPPGWTKMFPLTK